MFHHAPLALATFISFIPLVSAIPWNATEYMFAFGDSYTTDGYNISAGIDSPPTGYTSSDDLNWVGFLSGTYNQTALKTFNLAHDGATIDSLLVAPYNSSVLSIVDQVSEFKEYLAPKPEGAQWDSENSLFTIWIGINDVGISAYWSNITQLDFYDVLMDRLFSQVNELYDAGARNFLFLTVPPVNRAPLYLEQGSQVASQMRADIMSYNTQLTQSTHKFQATHPDLRSAMVFDTQPIFNTLLDEWKTFGFVNVTGYCAAYENGTSTNTYQIEGCAPVSSYFWLNSLHPLFTVHDVLAKAISTTLAGYSAI